MFTKAVAKTNTADSHPVSCIMAQTHEGKPHSWLKNEVALGTQTRKDILGILIRKKVTEYVQYALIFI